MRILYFSPRHLWPLHGGAHLRDFYLSRELARFAELHFLGIRNIEDSGADPGHKAHFESLTVVPKARSYTFWKMARGLVGPAPVTILNYHDPAVGSELGRILERTSFDVVQIEGVHLAPYLPLIRSSASCPRVVCDWHDIESDLMYLYSSYSPSYMRRFYAQRTAALLRNAERALLAACDAHLVVSEQEKLRLAEWRP
jgi:polysaccharide biosynthesis protein PslH